MLGPYLEARIKHIKENLSPALFEWNDIPLNKETPKQIKEELIKALGEPVATYRLTTPTSDVEQKCYCFKKEAGNGRTHSYTMLEYTKQKKRICK